MSKNVPFWVFIRDRSNSFNDYYPCVNKPVHALIEHGKVYSPDNYNYGPDEPELATLVLRKGSENNYWELYDPDPDQDKILHQSWFVVAWRYCND